MEYKCTYSVRGMLISEVWNKVDYFEVHEGKPELKRGHRYYTQITGEMTMSIIIIIVIIMIIIIYLFIVHFLTC